MKKEATKFPLKETAQYLHENDFCYYSISFGAWLCNILKNIFELEIVNTFLNELKIDKVIRMERL